MSEIKITGTVQGNNVQIGQDNRLQQVHQGIKSIPDNEGGVVKYDTREPVSRVEFIIRPEHIICNVLYYGAWRSTTLEVGINIIEFLERGSIQSVGSWKRGKVESNE